MRHPTPAHRSLHAGHRMGSGARRHLCRDRLPPPQDLPEFLFDLPELQFDERLNCATELLDRRVAPGEGAACACRAPACAGPTPSCRPRPTASPACWCTNMGLVPGNRVLLRGANTPMLAACWFAVVKAGGIAVGSMPLLRARELVPSSTRRRSRHALCDARLVDELALARPAECPTLRQHLVQRRRPGDLEARAAAQPATFDNVDTAADDTCLIAFTSGTTGVPKGTMHFHRDVMAACACWPPHVLRATPTTCSSAARRWPSPSAWVAWCCSRCRSAPHGADRKGQPRDPAAGHRAAYRATVCFTAPTSYRAMAAQVPQHDLRSPAQVRVGRRGPAGGHARAVAAGHGHRDHRRHRLHRDAAHLHLGRRGPRQARRHRRAVPGYRACVLDERARAAARARSAAWR
jgi:2-aminobenzoate-CoA ligase